MFRLSFGRNMVKLGDNVPFLTIGIHPCLWKDRIYTLASILSKYVGLLLWKRYLPSDETNLSSNVNKSNVIKYLFYSFLYISFTISRKLFSMYISIKYFGAYQQFLRIKSY